MKKKTTRIASLQTLQSEAAAAAATQTMKKESRCRSKTKP